MKMCSSLALVLALVLQCKASPSHTCDHATNGATCTAHSVGSREHMGAPGTSLLHTKQWLSKVKDEDVALLEEAEEMEEVSTMGSGKMQEPAHCPKECTRYFRGATADSPVVCQSGAGTCLGTLSNGKCPARYNACAPKKAMSGLEAQLKELKEDLVKAMKTQEDAVIETENAEEEESEVEELVAASKNGTKSLLAVEKKLFGAKHHHAKAGFKEPVCEKPCKRYFKGATKETALVCQSGGGTCLGQLSTGACPARYTKCVQESKAEEDELLKAIKDVRVKIAEAGEKQDDAVEQVQKAKIDGAKLEQAATE